MSAPAFTHPVVISAAIVGVVVSIVVALHRQEVPASTAKPASTTASGSFRPTPSQWATLTVEEVKTSRFDTVTTVDGNIAFNENHTTSVYSQFTGRVTAIYAQPGQRVRKGDALLAVLASETAQAKGDLAAASAAESTAKQQFELAQRTEHRQHELLLAQAGAEKDWLQSKVDLAAAENAWHAATAASIAARAKGAVLSISSDKAGPVPITSPIDGVVVARQVNPGQFVNSLAGGGSAALYTISDLRTVWVQANVGEEYSARIQLGQPIEVSSLALVGRRLESKISWIASSVDSTTHRVPIRAELANADLTLRPQMSVTLRVLDSAATPAVSVPRGALVYEGAQAHCYVADSNRTLTARAVVVGRVQGGFAEVTSGLAQGEHVVTRGSLFIDAAQGETS